MTLEFDTYGRGPKPVLMLHEWMSTHRGYAPSRPYLNPDRYTWVFVDHRGYGLSREMRGEHTVQEAATDVLRVADAMKADRFHLVGHSMSGMIAQWISLNAPERLRSVALVSPVPASGVNLDADGRALFDGAIEDDERWATVGHMVTQERLGAEWARFRRETFRSQIRSEALASFLRMWTETDFSARMKDLSTPALIIAGQHDIPPFQADAYRASIGQWYQQVAIEVIEGSGHFPMSETPPRFAHVLQSFLQSVD